MADRPQSSQSTRTRRSMFRDEDRNADVLPEVSEELSEDEDYVSKARPPFEEAPDADESGIAEELSESSTETNAPATSASRVFSSTSRKSDRPLSGPQGDTLSEDSAPAAFSLRESSALSRPASKHGGAPNWDNNDTEGANNTEVELSRRPGYPLDRERSAGRESLVSRGLGDGGRQNSEDDGAGEGWQGAESWGGSAAPPDWSRGPAMERPITRSGRMGTAGEQRPLTSAGRVMSRMGDRDLAPTRAVHPDRTMGDGNPMPMARPTTSGRVLTARPISAALKGAPSTATRLLTAASAARPGTRAGLATGRGLNTPINVVERPITQQGLTGMKTGARGPQRQVQDKSYYLGVLRSKMAEVGDEIVKLNNEVRNMKHEQSSFLSYDKRVKETAQELTELQGSLADFNLLIDLMNTDTEKFEIDEECKELVLQNQEEANKSEVLFGEKQELEATVRSLEAQLEDERHMGESVMESMAPELKNKYVALRNDHTYLQQQQEQLQQRIDSFAARKQGLEDELTMSKVKQEAVQLSDRLAELQQKKQQLDRERSERGTPKEERERLLLQVKEDNTEIATMERQISEAQEEMSRLQGDLGEMDQEIDEHQSERSQKYRELRRREETMEAFMAGFEQSREEERQRLDELEQANVELLERLSRSMLHFGGLPNVAEYDALRGDLAFKEGELEKSRYTVQGLGKERLNLQANLQKIEALETKVQKELVDIKEKLQRTENELVEYGDLEGLRGRADEKRKDLAVEKGELEAKKIALTYSLQDVEAAVKVLQKQLTDNDTHSQLLSLEKKWAALEQTNFGAREFVAQRKAESDYVPVKKQAMRIVVDYNRVLQEVIQSGGIIG